MSPIFVHLFAGAAEEFGTSETEIDSAADLSAVVNQLSDLKGPRMREILDQCSFFIDGQHHTSLDTKVPDGSRVDVLPPFAGG